MQLQKKQCWLIVSASVPKMRINFPKSWFFRSSFWHWFWLRCKDLAQKLWKNQFIPKNLVENHRIGSKIEMRVGLIRKFGVLALTRPHVMFNNLYLLKKFQNSKEMIKIAKFDRHISHELLTENFLWIHFCKIVKKNGRLSLSIRLPLIPYQSSIIIAKAIKFVCQASIFSCPERKWKIISLHCIKIIMIMI